MVPEHDALRPQFTQPVALSGLASTLGLEHRGNDTTVTGVALASSAVQPGDLFVAVRGVNRHGSEFWPEARAAGASGILTDDDGVELVNDPNLPIIRADNPRAVLGAVSAQIYGTVGDDVPTIYGVTGTNGKTSTAFLLEAILRGLGQATALSTTAVRQVRGETFRSSLTTPEAPDIHAMIARAHEEGVSGIAVEISAQALDKNRLDHVVCDVAGFTNLSHDHLEDFGTMENYLNAKAALFTPERARTAVICVDSTWGQQLAGSVDIPTVTVGHRGSSDAQWLWESVPSNQGMTTLRVDGPAGESIPVDVPLSGDHMLANTALAVVMVVNSGVSPADFAVMGPGTAGIPVFIPGRMEKVSGARGPQVYVDAGRSADAYEHTLSTLREHTTGQLIMVCGTSGNRDATKRPIMGATAARLADVVIVTDDDPRREDPDAIRQGLLEGARSVPGVQVHEIPDPSDAIRLAVSLAHDGDTILWTGPGSQDYRDIGGVKVPYSARSEARHALTDAGWGQQ